MTEIILALLQAVIGLAPEVEAAAPAFEALFSGQKVTSAQTAAMWTAIAALEEANATKAAAIMASSMVDAQPAAS